MLLSGVLSSFSQDIFISQYIEDASGGSFYKGIEIVNNTGADIDFTANNLEVFWGNNGNDRANSSNNPLATINSGVLADRAVMVLGTTDLISFVNANSPGVTTADVNFGFNGDDALILVYGGTDIDMFGIEGQDPGSFWIGNGVSTQNRNIQIQQGITTGDADGWSDPSTRFEDVADGNDPTGFGISPFPTNNPAPVQPLFAELPFTEDFQGQSDLSPFEAFSVSGSADWYLGDRNGDFWAEANAFGAQGPSDDWLISPAFDLRKYNNKELGFEYVQRFSDNNTSDPLQLLYSTDYDGISDPTNATWNVINAGIDNQRDDWDFDVIAPFNIDNISFRNVRFAFRYRSSGNGGGETARIRVDDISITGNRIAGNPTQLSIAETRPVSPIQNLNFQVIVEALDANGIPQDVAQDTDIEIQLAMGNGQLNGTTTATIPSGDYFTTVTVSYDAEETFEIIAVDRSTNLIQSANYQLTTSQGPSYLEIEDLERKAYVDVRHPEYYVTARNQDGSLNMNYDAFDVDLILYDLAGQPVDTVVSTFSQGTATFTNTEFETVGSFDVGAISQGLSENMRMPLDVNATPALTDRIVPKYFMGYFDGGQVYNEQIPNWALVTLENLHPNTEYNYTSAMVEDDYYQLGLNLLQGARSRGININYDDRTGEYWVNDFGRFNGDPDCKQERRYSTFVTGPGETSKDIWIPMLMNGDGMFASPLNSTEGDTLYWTVEIADENLNSIRRVQSQLPSEVIKFNPNPNDRQYSATGLWDDDTDLAPDTYLALYEETNDTRPYTVAKVMNGMTGIQTVFDYDPVTCNPERGFDQGTPDFYSRLSGVWELAGPAPNNYSGFTPGTPGAWATFIPNDSRLEKIEHLFRDGSINESYESPTAFWDGVNLDMTQREELGVNNAIQLQVPQLEVISYQDPINNEYCNDRDVVDITFLARGIAVVDVYFIDGTGRRNLLINNLDVNANEVNDIIDTTFAVRPQDFTEDPNLQLYIEAVDDPIYNDISLPFTLFDSPRIFSQSQSAVYCQGDEIILGSTSNGTNLTYQWFKDGLPIPGATSNGLVFASADYTDSGVYEFQITGENVCPVAQSDSIVIHVARDTEITEQPMNASGAIGGSAQFTFDAHANGLPPTYRTNIQWYRDSLPMENNDRVSGAQSDILHIRDLAFDDFFTPDTVAREYYAMIIGRCDTAYTVSVMIEESSFVINSIQSVSEVCSGEPLTFSVDATTRGNDQIMYQWIKDGVDLVDDMNITGSMTSALNIASSEIANEGEYAVRIYSNNNMTGVVSTPFDLDVKEGPAITQDLDVASNLSAGDPLNLSVTATGDADLRYEWFKDGVSVQDDIVNTYSIPATATGDTGEYFVVISNDCGQIQSASTIVTVTSGSVVSSVEEMIDGVWVGNPSPNPSNGSSAIKINMVRASEVSLNVISATGQTIKTIEKGMMAAGVYTINIDLGELNLPNGQYFVQVTIGNRTEMRKIGFIK
jgi:hypothetical protein